MPKTYWGISKKENSPERCVMQVPPMRMSLGMVDDGSVKVWVGGKDAHDFVVFTSPKFNSKRPWKMMGKEDDPFRIWDGLFSGAGC